MYQSCVARFILDHTCMKKVNSFNQRLITRFSLGGASFRLAMRCTGVWSIGCNRGCLLETRVYFTTTATSAITESQQVKHSDVEQPVHAVCRNLWRVSNMKTAGRIILPRTVINLSLKASNPSMSLGFEFPIPTRMECFWIYSILKCSHDRKVHRDRQRMKSKWGPYNAPRPKLKF